MKLSVFTVSTPEYGIEETVKVLKELGYDGIEWRIGNPPPAEKPGDYTFERRYWSYNLSTIDVSSVDQTAEEVKRICDKYEMEICSLTTYLLPGDTEAIERVMKAANTMNCKNIRVNVPNYNEKENYNDVFNRAVEQTKGVEKLAEKYGVKVNFEIHMGNIIPSASAAYRFASNFNPNYVGIIFDPGNMVHEGYENYRLGIELLGGYLGHVHAKNALWKLEETTEDGVAVWKPTWAPFKKGYVDFKKLVTVLKDVGYTGYISVEDFSNEEQTYEKLKGNIEFLRKITE